MNTLKITFAGAVASLAAACSPNTPDGNVFDGTRVTEGRYEYNYNTKSNTPYCWDHGKMQWTSPISCEKAERGLTQ